MTRVLANDAHHTLTADDLAIAANALHWRLNFHFLLLVCEGMEAAVIPSPAVYCVENFYLAQKPLGHKTYLIIGEPLKFAFFKRLSYW